MLTRPDRLLIELCPQKNIKMECFDLGVLLIPLTMNATCRNHQQNVNTQRFLCDHLLTCCSLPRALGQAKVIHFQIVNISVTLNLNDLF